MTIMVDVMPGHLFALWCLAWCLAYAPGCRSASAESTVIVAIKTPHWFGTDAYRTVPECTRRDGRPLICTWVDSINSVNTEADAVWYHLPHVKELSLNQTIVRDAPHQLTVAYQTEPPLSTCPLLSDAKFMSQFDLEMTHRRCSHVQVPYFYEWDDDIQNELFRDPVPFAEKLDAIAYINHNCDATPSNRTKIVAALMSLAKMPVDSYGTCLHNKEVPAGLGWKHLFDSKLELFKKYKFCIAMENSIYTDYVSEKVWQAFEAGCTPIYLGAPNILEFVPSPESIIDYRLYKTPEALMEHLIMLSRNRTAYDLTQRWRYQPLDRLAPGFRKMVLSFGSETPHRQCGLCQVVDDIRSRNVSRPFTQCFTNASWLEANRTGGNTWGPGSDDILKRPHAHRWSPNGVWDPFHEHNSSIPRPMPADHVRYPTLTVYLNLRPGYKPQVHLPRVAPLSAAVETQPVLPLPAAVETQHRRYAHLHLWQFLGCGLVGLVVVVVVATTTLCWQTETALSPEH